ncbi:MAG: hypothetical protein PHI12_08865 [Dehalococcoidales bacterium]|nr:hypothetical protein [Dehalococcoidales bacterium]
MTGFRDKLKLWPSTWAAATAYAIGDIIKPTTYADHCYKCTTAGTSAAVTEPTWGTTNGGTTADGTGTLVWTCYDKKTYNLKAPQDATIPYVVFGLLTDVPIGTFENPAIIEDMVFYVNCFSNISQAHVAQMADLVNTAVQNTTLTITGYTAMKCVREYIGALFFDDAGGIYQIPMRYRVQGSL